MLRIEPVGVAERDGEGWRTTWGVYNAGSHAVRLVGATAPHSLFRGETSLDLEVAGKGTATFALVVRIDAAAGGEIENAFVILLLEESGARWRVLARLRVGLDDTGTPHPRVESVTTQRVGFSGEL